MTSNTPVSFDEAMRRVYNTALAVLMDAAIPIQITLPGDKLAGMSAEVCQKCAPLKPYVLNIYVHNRVKPVSVNTGDFYLADAEYDGKVLWSGAISRWELPTILEKSLSVAIGYTAKEDTAPAEFKRLVVGEVINTVIDRCGDCYHLAQVDSEQVCTKLEVARTIDDKHIDKGFPDWCPLPVD